jgi:hypothetical protein
MEELERKSQNSRGQEKSIEDDDMIYKFTVKRSRSSGQLFSEDKVDQKIFDDQEYPLFMYTSDSGLGCIREEISIYFDSSSVEEQIEETIREVEQKNLLFQQKEDSKASRFEEILKSFYQSFQNKFFFETEFRPYRHDKHGMAVGMMPSILDQECVEKILVNFIDDRIGGKEVVTHESFTRGRDKSLEEIFEMAEFTKSDKKKIIQMCMKRSQ